MPNISYPIASNAHEALALLRSGKASRAEREKEAEALAGHRVAFVTQSIGPLYETRDMALDAYSGLIEDDRSGHIFVPANADRVCRLTCRLKDLPPKPSRASQPAYKEGRRWPDLQRPGSSVWQLSVSFWKTLPALAMRPSVAEVKGQARHLRRHADGEALTPDDLLALSQSPLLAARPQKALDFGLFDFIPPDNPGIIIADE